MPILRTVRIGAASPDLKCLLVGTLDEVRSDLADLAAKGVTETFVDLNFDPEIGPPDAVVGVAMRRAEEILEALAPQS